MAGEEQIDLSQEKNTSQLCNVINLGDVDICAAFRKMCIKFNRNDKT
jgi:hypothetical protein